MQLINKRYRVLRPLGSGGMGEVLLVEDTLHGKRQLALKQLHASGPQQHLMQQFLKYEFETMSRFEHPNLAKVYDFERNDADGSHFFTTEFVDGLPIGEFFTKHQELPLLLEALVALCRVLEYIHSRGFLHLDIKPGNILVKPAAEGLQLKLLDFGAARPAETLRDRKLAGTPKYMAPEIFSGEEVDNRADLYALGITLQSLLEEAFKNVAAKPTEVTALTNIAARLAAAAPQKRFSRANDVIDAINENVGTKLGLNFKPEPAALLSYLHSSQLIGREAELHRLETSADRGVIVIHGETGIGKSRLLREYRARMQLKSVRWLEVVCGSSEASFESIFRQLDMPLDDRATEPQIVAERLLNKLNNVAHATPTVLCIEDLHLAEAADLKLVAYLARAVALTSGSTPLKLILTCHNQGATLTTLLDAANQPLNLELKPFNASELEAFLGATLGKIVTTPGFRKALLTTTNGNPYFIEEFLKTLLQRFDDLRSAELDEAVLKRLGSPKTVRSLVDRQLETLQGAPLSLLEQLALCDRRVPLPLLMNLGSDRAQQQEAMATLQQLRLLRQTWDANEGLTIGVDKEAVREAVVARLPKSRQRSMHAAIAAAYSKFFKGSEASALIPLALHHLKAEMAQPGLRFGTQALALLMQRFALQEAETLLALMLPLEKQREAKLKLQLKLAEIIALLGRTQEARKLLQTAALSNRRVIEPQLQLAELEQRAGHHVEAKKITEKISTSTVDHAQRRRLLSLEAECAITTADYPEAVKTLLQLIEALGKEDATAPLLAKAYNTLGLACFYMEHYTDALKWLQLALKQSGNLLNQRERATALYRLGNVQMKLLNRDDALQLLTQARELAAATGDVKLLCSCDLNLGTLHQEQNRFEAALDAYGNGLHAAQRMQDQINITVASFNLATLLHFLGDYSGAAAHIARALGTATAQQQHYFHAYCRLLAGVIESEQGKQADGRRSLLQATRNIAKIGKSFDLMLCRLELAKLHQQSDKHRKALYYVRLLRHALLTSPNQRLQANVELIAAEIGTNDLALARTQLQEAVDDLENDPNFEAQDLLWRALYRLSRLCLRLGDAGKAQHALRECRDTYRALMRLLPKAYQESFAEAPPRRALVAAIENDMRELTRSDFSADSASELSRVIINDSDKLGPIFEITRKLNSLLDLKSLLDYIMEISMNLTGAKHAYLLIAAGDGFETYASRNLTEEDSRASTSIARLVMKNGKPLITKDASGDDRLESMRTVVDLKLRSILCLPLRLKGEIIGVLYLEHRTRQAAFSGDNLAVIEAITDQAAIAINNARLHTAVVEQEKKIRQLNRKLQSDLDSERQKLVEVERMLSSDQQALLLKYRSHNIIARSKKMRNVLELVDRVCESDVTVMVRGESGTGKELIARAIHYNGARKLRPFLTINCSALTETLLESELFGYEKGAFTGANRQKRGLFEVANSGTLFLDEVGDMSLVMQAKLLRVLQEGEVRRVGGNESLKVDVRIVSATNVDLEKAIKAGRFREDLYYRLNTIQIDLPALRQRREDIPILVRHLLAASDKPAITVSNAAMELFTRHNWPGNVRELENEINRALIFASGQITPQNLSPTLQQAAARDEEAPLIGGDLQELLQGKTLDAVMVRLEKEVLAAALKLYQGRKGQTAEELGVTRFTLYRKLKEYGLSAESEPGESS